MDNKDLVKIDRHLIDHSYSLPFMKQNFLSSEDEANNTDENESFEEIKFHEKNTNSQQSRDAKFTMDVVQPLNHQRAVTYRILPGVRLNSQVFMDNLHYRYYKNRSRKNKIYLVCENQKNRTKFCPATAFVSEDKKDNHITTFGKHNHLPPFVDIPMVYLRRNIGLAGTRSEIKSNSIRQLYRDIVQSSEEASNYSIQQAQRMVRRMRRSRRLDNPENFEELTDMVSQPVTTSFVSTLQRQSSRCLHLPLSFMIEEEIVEVIFDDSDVVPIYREDVLSLP